MINDVRVVGRLLKAPDFATTSQGKDFFRLVVETERFVRINGDRKRIAHTIAVTCFNQFSIQAMREHGKVGTVVKVFGELTGVRDNRPEVTVSQYNGEAAVMFGDDDLPAARADATERKADAPATAPTGGLGRLSASGGKPQTSALKTKEFDPSDDEIPF